MEWDILDTGVASAEENMRLDEALLKELDEQERPILHFYEWMGDCATYGYFLDPKEYLNLEGVKRRGLSLGRRPTGGGIVFHVWDLAFSVLVPSECPLFSLNTLENYAFVNDAVSRAVKEFLSTAKELELIPLDMAAQDVHCQRFCMAQPTKYDVVLDGRKIAGAAQRKVKQGFLHQGTIALVMPPTDYLSDILLPGTQVLEAMRTYTSPLLGNDATAKQMDQARYELRLLLKKHLAKQ